MSSFEPCMCGGCKRCGYDSDGVEWVPFENPKCRRCGEAIPESVAAKVTPDHAERCAVCDDYIREEQVGYLYDPQAHAEEERASYLAEMVYG